MQIAMVTVELDCDDQDENDTERSGDCDGDLVDSELDCNDFDADLLSILCDTNCDGFLDIEVVTTTYTTSCALDRNGTIHCWGMIQH